MRVRSPAILDSTRPRQVAASSARRSGRAGWPKVTALDRVASRWSSRSAPAASGTPDVAMSPSVADGLIVNPASHGVHELRVMAREFATRADDIVWRRTKLGLRMTPEQIATLDSYMQTAALDGALAPAAE